MNCEAGLLARQEGLGAVVCCARGCVHVQFGATTLTLTEGQYVQFVAMLADSASNYEMYRQRFRRSESEAVEDAGAGRGEADYPGSQAG